MDVIYDLHRLGMATYDAGLAVMRAVNPRPLVWWPDLRW
jgi:hypothetical protein